MPVTPETLFRVPIIRGLINEFSPNVTPFCEVYGTGMNDMGDEEAIPNGQGEFLYDVFNNTRTMNSFTNPYSGSIKKQKAGMKTRRGHLVASRTYMEFRYEDYLGFRQMGGSAATIDNRGQQRIAAQLRHHLQRHANLHEWAFSAMFRGALHLKIDADNGDMTPLPTSSGADVTITYPIPAAHTGQLPLGSGGANLIGAPFDNTNTDIPKYLRDVFAVTHRQSGTPFSNLWGSTKVGNSFFNNTVLRNQAGTSYRVFDGVDLQSTPKTVEGQNLPNMARTMSAKGFYTVQWRGLAGMEWTFRVTDAGMAFDASDERAEATWVPTLPINDLLMTPDAQRGVWWKKYVGKTLYRMKQEAPINEKTGFGFITYEMGGFNVTPARIIDFMDKFLYVLVQPYALYRPTVIF